MFGTKDKEARADITTLKKDVSRLTKQIRDLIAKLELLSAQKAKAKLGPKVTKKSKEKSKPEKKKRKKKVSNGETQTIIVDENFNYKLCLYFYNAAPMNFFFEAVNNDASLEKAMELIEKVNTGVKAIRHCKVGKPLTGTKSKKLNTQYKIFMGLPVLSEQVMKFKQARGSKWLTNVKEYKYPMAVQTNLSLVRDEREKSLDDVFQKKGKVLKSFAEL